MCLCFEVIDDVFDVFIVGNDFVFVEIIFEQCVIDVIDVDIVDWLLFVVV